MTALLSRGVPFFMDADGMKSLRINGQMRQFTPAEMPATISAAEQHVLG